MSDAAPPLPEDEVMAIAQSASRYPPGGAGQAENKPLAFGAQPVRLNWRTLTGREVPPRMWAIEHWLGFYLTLIAGRGGIGKSLLSQMIGTALALGRDFIDRVSHPQRVLIWACEDDHDEVWRRQEAINQYFGVDMSALDNLIVESRVGAENVLFSVEFGRGCWTPAYDQLREQVNDEKVNVLFLDNIGHTYAGNKADEHTVTRFGAGLSGLVREWPFCPAMLGHPARALGSEFSGAAAWENAARMRWYLSDSLPDEKNEESDPTSNVRYLAKRKQNYTAKDYRGFTYANGVLVPDAPDLAGPPGIVEAIRKRNAQTAVLEAIAWLAERNLYCTHKRNSPDRYLPKRMAAHKIHAGFSTKELDAALTALIGEGKVLADQVVGKNSARHDVLGLTLNQSKDTP